MGGGRPQRETRSKPPRVWVKSGFGGGGGVEGASREGHPLWGLHLVTPPGHKEKAAGGPEWGTQGCSGVQRGSLGVSWGGPLGCYGESLNGPMRVSWSPLGMPGGPPRCNGGVPWGYKEHPTGDASPGAPLRPSGPHSATPRSGGVAGPPHSPWQSPHSRRPRPRWGERPLSPGTARDAAAA